MRCTKNPKVNKNMSDMAFEAQNFWSGKEARTEFTTGKMR